MLAADLTPQNICAQSTLAAGYVPIDVGAFFKSAALKILKSASEFMFSYAVGAQTITNSRLVHHADIDQIEGDSYRNKHVIKSNLKPVKLIDADQPK